MEYVYVVSCWNDDTEPIVTVFNNAATANKYLEYVKAIFKGACLDRCPIYKIFTVHADGGFCS